MTRRPNHMTEFYQKTEYIASLIYTYHICFILRTQYFTCSKHYSIFLIFSINLSCYTEYIFVLFDIRYVVFSFFWFSICSVVWCNIRSYSFLFIRSSGFGLMDQLETVQQILIEGSF